MGYVMDMKYFPLTFCVILHLSLLLSLSLAPPHVTPLWGGWSRSWLHPPRNTGTPYG